MGARCRDVPRQENFNSHVPFRLIIASRLTTILTSPFSAPTTTCSHSYRPQRPTISNVHTGVSHWIGLKGAASLPKGRPNDNGEVLQSSFVRIFEEGRKPRQPAALKYHPPSYPWRYYTPPEVAPAESMSTFSPVEYTIKPVPVLTDIARFSDSTAPRLAASLKTTLHSCRTVFIALLVSLQFLSHRQAADKTLPIGIHAYTKPCRERVVVFTHYEALPRRVVLLCSLCAHDIMCWKGPDLRPKGSLCWWVQRGFNAHAHDCAFLSKQLTARTLHT